MAARAPQASSWEKMLLGRLGPGWVELERACLWSMRLSVFVRAERVGDVSMLQARYMAEMQPG